VFGLLGFGLFAFGSLARAGTSTIPDADVAAALDAAGPNRSELERVLDHFARDPDPRKLEAARFLIANMPGHGYVVTRLEDARGNVIPYDPLSYPTYEEARAAIDRIAEEYGDDIDFKRDGLVKDVETLRADYLIRHIDEAFAAWAASPPSYRVSFQVFLDFLLPFRGSQEPAELWIMPLRSRYAGIWKRSGDEPDPEAVMKRLWKDIHERMRFNERFYLHPTDLGFAEMLATGQGRCEDLANMAAYAARSVALATAQDYTPAWAHRDNNHAWTVILDRRGRGSAPQFAHAAKVYRKAYAAQRDSLPYQLPEGAKAPNRFLASRFSIDVTDQYGPTTDVLVTLFPEVAKDERFAYLCVFNGGQWVAIDWGRVKEGKAVFDRMGRNVCYLPVVFRDGKQIPAGAPLLLEKDGTVRFLPGRGPGTRLVAVSARPRQKSVDTKAVQDVSYLIPGETYVLQAWTPRGWQVLAMEEATERPLVFEGLATDGLYWLVAHTSRRLERIFTLENDHQRWW
ncbi:MAG: transglutaminase domain-containing protein, partial [Planctomycetota bacterium]